MSPVVTWWILAIITVIGALGVLFDREVMRVMLGLGCFLLGVAGLYAFHAASMLAVAQVFVYVGGVLVLFLFAISGLRRGENGRLEIERTMDLGAAAVSAVLFVMLVVTLRPLFAGMGLVPVTRVDVDALGAALLGPLLPQFEMAGVLLLVALVSVLAIAGRGGDER